MTQGINNFLYKNEDMSLGSQIHKNADAKAQVSNARTPTPREVELDRNMETQGLDWFCSGKQEKTMY